MNKFWSWLFVALFIGVVVWRRSHKREMLLGANEITPILTEKVCLKIDQNTFDKKVLPYWAVEGIRPMKAVERTMRYVFDQARISWFHWGFFYTIEITDNNGQELNLSVGIAPKGPPPLRGKRLRIHLEKFIALIDSDVQSIKDC